MSCLGVHFALTSGETDRLLAAQSEAEVLNIVKEEIEAQWNEDWLQETGKEWEAIHRCLTDGPLVPKDSSPLSKCILGGRQLYHSDDYIVSFLSPEEVKDVTSTIKGIDRQWWEQKYFALNEDDMEFSPDDVGFEESWAYFQELQVFFQKAAQASRAIIFMADQ